MEFRRQCFVRSGHARLNPEKTYHFSLGRPKFGLSWHLAARHRNHIDPYFPWLALSGPLRTISCPACVSTPRSIQIYELGNQSGRKTPVHFLSSAQAEAIPAHGSN